MIALYCIYIISSLIGAVFFKKITAPFRWIAVLLWLTLLNEISARFLYENGFANAPFAHLYTILCVPIYFMIYQSFLAGSLQWKAIRIVFIFLFLFCIIDSWCMQPTHLMPTYNANATSLVVVTCALIVFMKMLDEPVATPLRRQSKFWMNTSVFLYHSASFFLWTITNYFYENKIPMETVWITNVVMCWLFYSVLGISIWLNQSENRNG